jgi:hypothetical protein
MKRDINKLQVENVHIEVYHTWLNIYVGDTVYDCLFHAGLLRNTTEKTWATTDALFWVCSKKNAWFIAFNKGKINPGTIAHECFHATCRILKQKGILYTEDTEEAYAYLLDYLVTTVTGLILAENIVKESIIPDSCESYENHEFVAVGSIPNVGEQHAICHKCGFKP